MATTQGASDLSRFMDALIGQESGGDANATNSRTQAMGLGQILPSNWEPWNIEAGLNPNDYSEANQRAVIRFKLKQYFDKFGNWEDVAAAWYSGSPRTAYTQYELNRPQGAGDEPSIQEYVDGVISRMGTITSNVTAKRADGFTEPFGSNLDRLLADFGGRVWVNSGFRTQEEQQALWENSAQDGIMVAAPATEFDAAGNALNGSYHGRGMAADLGYRDEATKAEVHAKAAQYSLWFPMDYEDWHIEPIGSRDGTYVADTGGIQGVRASIPGLGSVPGIPGLGSVPGLDVLNKLMWFADFGNLFRLMQGFAGIALIIGGAVIMVGSTKTVGGAIKLGANVASGGVAGMVTK